MALKIIVSYDDTDNDRDALALGRLLAFSGAELSLAYVRHSQGGALEEKEAEELLARGAASVGAPDMPRHVVVNAGTSVGLAELAEREDADIIVFGSEYRTAPGTVKPGIPAHKLLLGGPAAIAVAPAGLRVAPVGQRQHDRRPRRGRRDRQGDRRTASRRRSAPSVGEPGAGPVDLLVVGSRPESPQGKVTLSAASDYAVEAATYPVLVVPRGVALSFAAAAGLRRRLTTRMTAATSGSRPSILSCASAQCDRPARRWPASISAASASGESASTTKASGSASALGAASSTRRVTSRPSARRSTSPGRRRGPAPPAAGPRGSSAALARVPLLVAQLDRAGRRATARGPSPQLLAARLKTRAW